MREDGRVDCAVAREALSARLDGEREPVPSARVDEHVRSCPRCTAWFADTREHAMALRRLAGAPLLSATPPPEPRRGAAAVAWSRRYLVRALLGVVGVAQVGLAAAQMAGAHFGMVAAHHGAATGAHLLNESTAWSAALGVVMVAAALRPAVASGLACLLVTYVALLGYYVVADGIAGQVTTARVLSHAPVVLAAVLTTLLWDGARRVRPVTRPETFDAPVPGVRLRIAAPGEQPRPTTDSAA